MPFAVISRLAMNANGTIINVLIFFFHVRAILGILRGGGGGSGPEFFKGGGG